MTPSKRIPSPEDFYRLVADNSQLLAPSYKLADVFYEELRVLYSQPRRKYHTLEHVYWVLKRIEDMEAEDKTRGSMFVEPDWTAIKLAAWYHDAILEGSPDDEEKSSELAFSRLQKLHVPCYAKVRELVLATGHARIPLTWDANVLCDADLSILGAEREAFDNYEKLVREEWEHVPEEIFKVARATILKKFDARPWIYMTEYGRIRWERQARANLSYSIAKLLDQPHWDKT